MAARVIHISIKTTALFGKQRIGPGSQPYAETARTITVYGGHQPGANGSVKRRLTNPAYLVLAGKIVSVEARHAAWIRDIISNGTFADSTVIDANGLDKSRTPAEVLSMANTYLVTKVSSSNLPTS